MRPSTIKRWILWILLPMGLVYHGHARAETYQPGVTTSHILTIVDGVTGTVISGEDPTIACSRISDGYWYDFDDQTFKIKGSVVELTDVMNEETGTGRYFYQFDTTGWQPDHYIVMMTNGGDSAVAATTDFAVALSTVPHLGSGQIPVNHDYPDADDMTVEDPLGSPIQNVYVRVYLRADYDAGLLGASYIKGLTMTDANGEWEEYIWLNSADYTATFIKTGLQTQTVEFTVP